MSFSNHCDLCENEITDLKKGLTCKLTDKYPDLKNICSKIKFDEKFQSKIEIVNLELERIRRDKKSVYVSFYFLIIIGFIIIIGGNYFIKSTFKSVYTFKISFGIISVGITFLGVAYTKLNAYKKKFRNAKFDKTSFDEFLEKYKIRYKANFDFKEKIYGTQEVIVGLEFMNWDKKTTTKTYKIS